MYIVIFDLVIFIYWYIVHRDVGLKKEYKAVFVLTHKISLKFNENNIPYSYMITPHSKFTHAIYKKIF